MPGAELIGTLAGGLCAALVAGYATHRVGLSPIVGYLVAGILVGPHTPGFVADVHLAEQLAEVGIILLMFGVGLQFHLHELLAVRRVAVPGAVLQSAVATFLGAGLAVAFGWTWSSGIVFGMALAVASTVVLVRVLADNAELHTRAGHVAIGWLVVEDLFTVVALVLLPALFGGTATSGSEIVLALLYTALQIGALVAFTAVVGTRVIPRVLDHVAHTGSRELFTLAVLAIALGIAFGAATLFGVSMALGAFLAGMVVGRSEYSLRAATDALPMRDAFAVLFFVSVGMLLTPSEVLAEPLLTLGALGIVLIGKPLAAVLVVALLGYPLRTALVVAVGLAQIGEFSFILASLGRDLDVLPPRAENVIVAVAIASIVVNPLLYRAIPAIERALQPMFGARPAAPPELPSVADAHRAIVVGYGPVGRTVVRLLRENGVEPTVVELNMDAVRELRAAGVGAVYGDATHRDTLVAAGLAGARWLVLTSSGLAGEALIATGRAVNPDARVLARTSYLRESAALRGAGAHVVFSGEGEVALALTEAVLDRLGATRDQIDRERARVHEELSG